MVRLCFAILAIQASGLRVVVVVVVVVGGWIVSGPLSP